MVNYCVITVVCILAACKQNRKKSSQELYSSIRDLPLYFGTRYQGEGCPSLLRMHKVELDRLSVHPRVLTPTCTPAVWQVIS